jgi:hypothetical protein
MDIFASNGAGADSRAIVSIRVANIDGLIQEYDVRMRIPAEWVVSCVATIVSDTTRTQFE